MELFNHKEVVKKVAQKHGLDEVTTDKIIRMFFTKWGIYYFIRRFYQVRIGSIGLFKATKLTYSRRKNLKERYKLNRLRWTDKNKNPKWSRPDNY